VYSCTKYCTYIALTLHSRGTWTSWNATIGETASHVDGRLDARFASLRRVLFSALPLGSFQLAVSPNPRSVPQRFPPATISLRTLDKTNPVTNRARLGHRLMWPAI
jgi:hypothetical protein